MKQWHFVSFIVAFLISIFTLAGYGYNISAFAATLASKVGFLEQRQAEDRAQIKEDLNYIRDRVDKIYRNLPKE